MTHDNPVIPDTLREILVEQHDDVLHPVVRKSVEKKEAGLEIFHECR